MGPRESAEKSLPWRKEIETVWFHWLGRSGSTHRYSHEKAGPFIPDGSLRWLPDETAEITTSNRLNHNLLLCVVFYPNRNITDSSLPRLLNFVSSACTEEAPREGRSLSTGQENTKWTKYILWKKANEGPKFYAYFSCLLCFYPVEGISDRPLVTNPCYFFIFLSRFCCGWTGKTIGDWTN